MRKKIGILFTIILFVFLIIGILNSMKNNVPQEKQNKNSNTSENIIENQTSEKLIDDSKEQNNKTPLEINGKLSVRKKHCKQKR